MATPASLRVFEAHARVYRHTWRGSVISTFLNPILFLTAMGVILGQQVDRATAVEALGAASYLEWLAPGLLVAAVMQTAAGESSWPVMAGIKWRKTYDAALATPVSVADLYFGHIQWMAVRLTMTAIVFTLIMAAFGAVSVGAAVVLVLPALLTGLAYGAPVTAFTARLKDETGLSTMFRFAIVPMFLFSGTFFPISQLPDWMEPVAVAVPLWHGVELSRWVSLSIEPAWPPAAHATYLAFWFAAGTFLAVRYLRERLIS